jgi:hypothetical protein
MRQRNAHPVQGDWVASAGRIMICGQIRQITARDYSKCSVARHRCIQLRG